MHEGTIVSVGTDGDGGKGGTETWQLGRLPLAPDLQDDGTTGGQAAGGDGKTLGDEVHAARPAIDGHNGILREPADFGGRDIRRVGNHEWKALIGVEHLSEHAAANVDAVTDTGSRRVTRRPVTCRRIGVHLYQRAVTQDGSGETYVTSATSKLEDGPGRHLLRQLRRPLALGARPRTGTQHLIVERDRDRPERHCHHVTLPRQEAVYATGRGVPTKATCLALPPDFAAAMHC